MNAQKTVRLAIGCTWFVVAAGASATGVDGFHMIQVLPVVVTTASFTSEIYVFNPSGSQLNFNFTYYPGAGTPQVGPLFCGAKVIPANTTVTYSLSGGTNPLCPTLPSGSNFGWLEAQENSQSFPFNVFMRVNNPQGQGFAIEAYPPHAFTGGVKYVTGLKRQSAAPGYQTNCFFGALAEPADIQYSVLNDNGSQLGAAQTLSLAAREFVRVLDVFAAVGAPAGDHANKRLRAQETTPGANPGVIVFCTVQNNTNFDADFRIAKIYPASSDDHALRDLTEGTDALGNPFRVGVFPNSRSRHSVYFKHPDWVECSVQSAALLEMRLVAPDKTTVVAGGDNQALFGPVYLGAKGAHNSGRNGRWYIDVEARSAAGDNAVYSIICFSGSGHGSYEWVGRSLPNAF